VLCQPVVGLGSTQHNQLYVITPNLDLANDQIQNISFNARCHHAAGLADSDWLEYRRKTLASICIDKEVALKGNVDSFVVIALPTPGLASFTIWRFSTGSHPRLQLVHA
jgi:hypothetical protein